jgi:hypothetical protein
MPTADRRVIPRTTDVDLEPWFDAVCRGLRQSLTWGPRYCLPTERIVVHAEKHMLPPRDMERIAAHYRAKCREGTPSFPRFADDIDRWRADWSATQGGGRPKRQAADLRAAGKCPEHPAESLDTLGECELCREIGSLRQKLGAKRTAGGAT